MLPSTNTETHVCISICTSVSAYPRITNAILSTKYFDDELQTYYYGYRYYSPGMGRWISRDPAEEGAGPLLYGYLFNQPINIIDKWGLCGTPFNCDDFTQHFDLGGGVLGYTAVDVDIDVAICDCCSCLTETWGQLVENGYINVRQIRLAGSLNLGIGFNVDLGRWPIPEGIPIIGGTEVHFQLEAVAIGPGQTASRAFSGVRNKCVEQSLTFSDCHAVRWPLGFDEFGIGGFGTFITLDAALDLNLTACLRVDNAGVYGSGSLTITGGARLYGELASVPFEVFDLTLDPPIGLWEMTERTLYSF